MHTYENSSHWFPWNYIQEAIFFFVASNDSVSFVLKDNFQIICRLNDSLMTASQKIKVLWRKSSLSWMFCHFSSLFKSFVLTDSYVSRKEIVQMVLYYFGTSQYVSNAVLSFELSTGYLRWHDVFNWQPEQRLTRNMISDILTFWMYKPASFKLLTFWNLKNFIFCVMLWCKTQKLELK